jgi:hypothetical protein
VVFAAVLGLGTLARNSDWQFFAWGTRLLFGVHTSFQTSVGHFEAPTAGGLHLYANYPILQIGPPALLAARLLSLLPHDGTYAATVVIQGLGVLSILCVDRVHSILRPRDWFEPWSLLIAGSFLLGCWAAIANFGHLDDAMTLTLVLAAAWALASARAGSAGLLLGLAAATKPWAVALIPLALALPNLRTRITCALVAVTTLGVFWLPFVLADRGTLRLGQLPLEVHGDSAATALGIAHLWSGQTTRLVQILVGVSLTVLAVLARRWMMAPLLAFSFRLLVDPMSYPYYGASLVAAAMLVDFGGNGGRVPKWTIATAALCLVANGLGGHAAGGVRAVEYLGVLTVAGGCLWRAADSRGTWREGVA